MSNAEAATTTKPIAATEVPAGREASQRGFLRATAMTAIAALIGTLAVWAIASALIDVPDRFVPLQPGAVVAFTLVGALLAAAVFRALAGRSSTPVATFRRLVPIALVVSLVPDALIWASGAYDGAAEAKTVLPVMAMHVVAAAACWTLLPSALRRGDQPTA